MVGPKLTINRRARKDIPMDVPICSKCQKDNDRPPHRYCRACHQKVQRERTRTHVMIPINMITKEQADYLNRKRPGRRRSDVSRLTNVSTETGGT